MLVLVILLLILCGVGGPYFGYREWGAPHAMGILGLVLIVLLVLYLSGALARL